MAKKPGKPPGGEGRTGRPSRLEMEPEVVARFLQAVQVGMPIKWAAHLTRIAYQTILNWEDKGEGESEGIYRDFLDSLKKAEAEAMFAHLGAVARRVPQWQANMTIMQRRWPEEWGIRYEHTGPGGGPIPHAHSGALVTIPANADAKTFMEGMRKIQQAAALAAGDGRGKDGQPRDGDGGSGGA